MLSKAAAMQHDLCHFFCGTNVFSESSSTSLELDSSLFLLLDSSRSPFLMSHYVTEQRLLLSDWSNVSAPPTPRSSRAGADAADSWHGASAEGGRLAGPAAGAASCVSAGCLFKYRTTLSRSSRLLQLWPKKFFFVFWWWCPTISAYIHLF